MEEKNFIPFEQKKFEGEALLKRVSEFYAFMNKRRSLRMFSDKPIPKKVIENIIMTASTAPSGANKQPWTFCAVSNPAIKKKIREAAEEEEKINYSGRMSDSWLNDLKPFDTDENKPFLEIAPWLIVVFKRSYEELEGEKKNNYYVSESVGLAAGMLLAAIHQAGLVSLTHTPSPMNFLTKVLNRPKNEKPFLLIPVGYAPEGALVPDITRKSADEVITYFE